MTALKAEGMPKNRREATIDEDDEAVTQTRSPRDA